MREIKPVDMIDFPSRGRSVLIRAVVDDIRNGRIICRNRYGYFYSVNPNEVYIRQKGTWIRKGNKYVCPECGHKEKRPKRFCEDCGSEMEVEE